MNDTNFWNYRNILEGAYKSLININNPVDAV